MAAAYLSVVVTLLMTSSVCGLDVALGGITKDVSVREWKCKANETGCVKGGIIVALNEQKDGDWSGWFDNDWPTATGDFEQINHIRSHRHYRCDKAPKCEQFTAIRIALANGGKTPPSGATVTSVGDKLHVDFFTKDTKSTAGFYCLNKENPEGCHNYKVNFFCPKDARNCIEPSLIESLKRSLQYKYGSRLDAGGPPLNDMDVDESRKVSKKAISLLKLLQKLSESDDA